MASKRVGHSATQSRLPLARTQTNGNTMWTQRLPVPSNLLSVLITVVLRAKLAAFPGQVCEVALAVSCAYILGPDPRIQPPIAQNFANPVMEKPVFLLLSFLALSITDVSAQSAAYKLTVINETKRRDMKTVETRFDFVLEQMNSVCLDSRADEKIGSVLVSLHKKIKSAGLGQEETLLQFTNNLYRVTTEVETYYRSSSKNPAKPDKCLRPWSMYLTLRELGYHQGEAISGAVAGTKRGL